MFRVLGLVLTAGLLLSFTACGEPAQNQSQNQNQNKSESQKQPNAPTPSAANTAATSAPSAAETAPMTATVKNAAFSWKDDASGTPVTTIKVGGTVTWTITSAVHSLKRAPASADNGCDELEGSFDSQPLQSGKSVTRTFTKAGTFGYLCGIHGGTPNCKTPPGSGAMPGVIKVVP